MRTDRKPLISVGMLSRNCVVITAADLKGLASQRLAPFVGNTSAIDDPCGALAAAGCSRLRPAGFGLGFLPERTGGNFNHSCLCAPGIHCRSATDAVIREAIGGLDLVTLDTQPGTAARSNRLIGGVA
jgi:hypothetical protein